MQGAIGPSMVDFGGTRLNIVPPGQSGLVNSIDFALSEGGTVVPQLAGMGMPAHQSDQRSMYGDLIKVAPHLTDAQLLQYYKDASFDTDAANAERIERPRTGVVIIRD